MHLIMAKHLKKKKNPKVKTRNYILWNLSIRIQENKSINIYLNLVPQNNNIAQHSKSQFIKHFFLYIVYILNLLGFLIISLFNRYYNLYFSICNLFSLPMLTKYFMKLFMPATLCWKQSIFMKRLILYFFLKSSQSIRAIVTKVVALPNLLCLTKGTINLYIEIIIFLRFL